MAMAYERTYNAVVCDNFYVCCMFPIKYQNTDIVYSIKTVLRECRFENALRNMSDCNDRRACNENIDLSQSFIVFRTFRANSNHLKYKKFKHACPMCYGRTVLLETVVRRGRCLVNKNMRV